MRTRETSLLITKLCFIAFVGTLAAILTRNFERTVGAMVLTAAILYLTVD